MNEQRIYAPSVKHIFTFLIGPPMFIYSILLFIHLFENPASKGFFIFMAFPVVFFELLVFSSSTFKIVTLEKSKIVAIHLLYRWKSTQIQLQDISEIKDDLDIPGTKKAVKFDNEANPIGKQFIVVNLYLKLRDGSTVELEFHPDKTYKRFKETLRNYISTHSK